MGNIVENNRLIAEFMELSKQLHVVESPISGEYIDYNELEYDSDWNWLMPVVERIESLGYFVNITLLGCLIKGDVEKFKKDRSDFYYAFNDNSKIKAVYKAVITFITWYNQNK